MQIADPCNSRSTIEVFVNGGIQKAKQRLDCQVIKSFLAGTMVSFGCLLMVTVGGGSLPVITYLGPGVHKLLQAFVFPVGLVLIVITGADIFTGNVTVFTISTLHKKTTWIELALCWTVSFFGNLLGCIFVQYILVYFAGLLINEPYRSFVMQIAETKGKIRWHEMFLRGIGGNWLVCLALWLAASSHDLHSKILGIYLPISLFIAVGYEHCVANMFTVQMGMILGANLSIGKYISHVLIPVTLGNVIGGAFFVGLIYWYLYLARSSKNNEQKNSLEHKFSDSSKSWTYNNQFKLEERF